MKVTVILKDLTDEFYAKLALLLPVDAFEYLVMSSTARDLQLPVKIGNGSFRDRVELNQMRRNNPAFTYKLEPRKGYKLATFEVRG